MHIIVLKSKLAYAKVTATELWYEGSITIDEDWMDKVFLKENEQVHVVNINNGERLITYVIPGKRGSKTICLNGPAARTAMVGDEIMILSYASIDPDKESLSPHIFSCRL